MSRRSIREARITEWVHSPYVAAPISEANRWLITGPDTMPRALKSKVHWLASFWRYTAEGIMRHAREAWLAIPEVHRFMVMLKHEYHPFKIEKLYEGTPILMLIQKEPTIGRSINA